MPGLPPPPCWEPIDDRLLEAIYAADQAIYPAPLLTYQRLRGWAATCPELSICLRRRDEGATLEGVVIVLPLEEEYWGRLAVGELKEHEVDPGHMFPSCGAGAGGQSQVVRVGLHVFHVERYSPSAIVGARAPSFTLAALEEVRSRVGDRLTSWDIVGYSALTATPQGNRVFKRLGFTTRYVETKADGDEVEMLVRGGNGIFTALEQGRAAGVSPTTPPTS